MVSDPHVLLHPHVRPEKMSVQLIPTVKEISPPVRVRVKAPMSVCLRRLLRRAVEVPPVLLLPPVSLARVVVLWMLTALAHSRPAALHVRACLREFGWRLLRKAVEVLRPPQPLAAAP